MCEYNDEYLSLGIDDGEDKNLHFFCVVVVMLYALSCERTVYKSFLKQRWTSWRPWCLQRRRAWPTRPVRWVWQTFGFLSTSRSASCCIWPTSQIPSRSFRRCHWWTSSWLTSPLRRSQYPGAPASRLCRCRSCKSRLSSSTSSRHRLWRSSLLVSFLFHLERK